MPAPTTVRINGYALREIRKRTAVSVQALAAAVPCDRSYIAKIELGHTHQVSPEFYLKLLRALEIEDRRTLMAAPHAAPAEGVA